MREIKFRGKGFNNKWRYGFLLKSKNNIAISIPYSKTGIKNYFVDENTIGQYTGLKDKNGVEIYEGDIIEFSFDTFTGDFDTKVGKGIILFCDGAFYVCPIEIEERKIKDRDNEEWFLIYHINLDELEVIGNIYENPELVGDKNE